MAKDNLENIFKNTLGDYHSDIDNDALWGQVKPRPKKRRFFLLLFIVLGLLVTSTTVFLLLNKSRNPVSMVKQETSPQGETNHNENHINPNIIDSNYVESDQSKLVVSQKNSTDTNSENEHNSVIKNKINQNIPLNLSSNSSSGTNSKSTRYSDSQNTSESQKSLSFSETLNGSKTRAKQSLSTPSSQSTGSQFGLVSRNNQKTERNNSQSFEVSDKNVLSLMKLNESRSKKDDITRLQSVSQLSIPESYVLKSRNFMLIKELRQPYSNKQKNFFTIGLEISPYISIRHFKALNEDTSNWVEERLKYESPLDGYNLNLNGQYVMKNLYIKAGFSIDQLNERFMNDKIITTREIRTEGPVEIIIGSDGTNVDTILGQVIATETNTKNMIIFNRYRSVNVSISAGYRHLTDAWGYAIGAGLVYNLKSYSSGTVSRDKEIINVTSIMKSSQGFSAILHPRLLYKLNSSTNLALGPFAKFNFSNRIREEFPISLTYTHIGIRLGIEYRF